MSRWKDTYTVQEKTETEKGKGLYTGEEGEVDRLRMSNVSEKTWRKVFFL